jgi:hypothetical protein
MFVIEPRPELAIYASEKCVVYEPIIGAGKLFQRHEILYVGYHAKFFVAFARDGLQDIFIALYLAAWQRPATGIAHIAAHEIETSISVLGMKPHAHRG